MNKKYGIGIALGLSLLTLGIYHHTAKSSPKTTTIVYEPSNEDFANPERGFYAAFDPQGNQPAPPLTVDQLKNLSQPNITLARRIYLIADFRNKHLSQEFLDKVAADLATARQAGIKLILRFTYNWENGGQDASQARIISHWEQLKSVLSDNYDAIAYLEAGFIGHWGEWNRSSYGLQENPQARKAILEQALSVVPKERMVAIRYPHHKPAAFSNNNPLTAEEAFRGTERARIGFHNDCLFYGIDHGGTYNSTDPHDIAQQKLFLSLDNRYVVQGGEFCHPTAEILDCPKVVKELSKMHWSTLNILQSYDPLQAVYEEWQNQGCFPEISRHLGYRFEAVELAIPTRKIVAGDSLAMKLTMANQGWSSPYNPRGAELILRHLSTGTEYSFLLQEDPRKWMPGQTTTINITGKTENTMIPGEYQLFLNLPDPSPKLRDRPEYSIRLANQGVWEESTGYNFLLTSITIESQSTVNGQNLQ